MISMVTVGLTFPPTFLLALTATSDRSSIISVGHVDEPSQQKGKSGLQLSLRDETDGQHTHTQEQDHVSAWEISQTHLTLMKTDVPSDFY